MLSSGRILYDRYDYKGQYPDGYGPGSDFDKGSSTSLISSALLSMYITVRLSRPPQSALYLNPSQNPYYFK